MKEIIEYYDNGEISKKFHEDDNGNIHGLYQRWYSNGQPHTKCHFINGNLHGLYQAWYSDGEPHIKYHYINGNYHGLYQSWYKNGQLSREAIYINNEETDLPIPKSRDEKILFKIKHGIEI